MTSPESVLAAEAQATEKPKKWDDALYDASRLQTAKGKGGREQFFGIPVDEKLGAILDEVVDAALASAGLERDAIPAAERMSLVVKAQTGGAEVLHTPKTRRAIADRIAALKTATGSALSAAQ